MKFLSSDNNYYISNTSIYNIFIIILLFIFNIYIVISIYKYIFNNLTKYYYII
jgi:hypothetical protein